MNETESADRDNGDNTDTSVIRVRKAKAALNEMTQHLPAPDRDQPNVTRASWVRRLFNMLRRG
jgi:hypothetical protein